MYTSIEEFNRIKEQNPEEVQKSLQQCCGSSTWVKQMLQEFPFQDMEQLRHCALKAEEHLTNDDWKESFRAHPRIGKNPKPVKKWEAEEQQSTQSASEQTLHLLEQLNEEYYEKFGFIFIVCATGKSAAEMLQILQERLQHPPSEELPIAAKEQSKITQIRLNKLIKSNLA